MDNEKLNKLKNLLLNEDLEKHKDEVFEIIPELKFEDGFDQKTVWHDLDVWHHTIKAVNSCDKNFYDRLTLLLHDIGKPFCYQEDGDKIHFKGHAEKSKEMSKIILARLGIDKVKSYEILSLIGLHSTTIDLRSVDSKNLSFYKHLLKIQKCDGSAYEKTHSIEILKKLNQIEKGLKEKEEEKEI